ncbi:MAG: hypothetical protein KF831_10285 [Acidobacteria bacterium]|nr:hypothetical protein [Acidobacteriota bacterium]
MAKRKPTTTEQAIERMKAVNDRVRVKVASDGEFDISLAPLSWWRERWHDREIQRLFIENFIYIRDAFDENKLTLFKFNEIQEYLHFNVTGKDVVIKSRRQGLSTYFKARFFANAVVRSGRNVRIVPHDPDTEEAFRADFKVMYENLAPHLKPATKYYSEALIEFKDPAKGTINSRISTASVQPGHEGKGRGQTITDLHLTEPPFWRGDAKKAATSLLEAAQGGQVCVESTPFGIEWTHTIYQQGKKGEAGWTSFFFEWWWKRSYRVEGARIEQGRKREWVLLQPGETLKDVWQVPAAGITEIDRIAKRNRFDAAKLSEEEIEICKQIRDHLRAKGHIAKKASWHIDAVAERIAWRRWKIAELPGGEAQFKVEYPENDIDCFEQTGRPLIKGSYLKVTCRTEGPREGREYIIGCDTSLGHETGDPAAIEILDLVSGRQVHSESLKRSPDLIAYRLQELHEMYNRAVVVVERNNTGIATIRELQKLIPEEFVFRYIDRRLQRKIEDGDMTPDEAFAQAEFGLPTTEANKAEYAIELERAVRTGEIGLSSEEWCEECRTCVWFDNGKWGAMSSSYHDDRVIALAIAQYVRVKLLGQFMGFVGVLPETGYAR